MARTKKIATPSHIEKRDFSILETIKIAWHDIRYTKRIFWTVTALLVVVVCSVMLLEQQIDAHALSPALTRAIIIFARIVSGITSIVLGLGLVYLGIQRAFQSSIQLAMINYVLNFSLLKNVIGLYILQFIILLPVVALFYVSAHFTALFPSVALNSVGNLCRSISVIVSLIATLYLSMRLYLTKAIIVAEKTTPWIAIQQSLLATKSHTGKLFGLCIINIVVLIISAIPLGIGLLWSIPFCFINYGVVYKQLAYKS